MYLLVHQVLYVLYTVMYNLYIMHYRLKEQAVDDVDQQKMAERQAHFDDLPQWKKKLILQNKVS